MPQNPIFIKMNEGVIYNMKDIFYQNIIPLCKKYGAEIYDYCHLNPMGRMAFSKLFVKEVLGE